MIMMPDGIAHITNPYISRACNIISANIQLLRTEELFELCKRVMNTNDVIFLNEHWLMDSDILVIKDILGLSE